MKTFRALATVAVAAVLALAYSLTPVALADNAVSTAGDTTANPTAGDLNFSVNRLSGSNRYGTAAAISREFFAPGVPVAVIATGNKFPDGLAAGPAADELGGPVLFVSRTSVPSVTRTELLRLKPQRILVVGGTAAISSAVRSELDTLTAGSATRVSGSSRYETAAAVSQSAFPGGASIAYLAVGENFPDALTGGAAAGIQGAPMLLKPTATLNAATKAELQRLNPDRIMILGGTA